MDIQLNTLLVAMMFVTILSMGMDPDDLRLVTARKAFGLPKMPRMRQKG